MAVVEGRDRDDPKDLSMAQLQISECFFAFALQKLCWNLDSKS